LPTAVIIDEEAMLAEALSALARQAAALAAQAGGPMAIILRSVQPCIGAAASQLRAAEAFAPSAAGDTDSRDRVRHGDLPKDCLSTDLMDWQNLTDWLAPVGRRWDIAVLANLPPDGDWIRPADLRDTINMQVGPERQISWKVLKETLRRLEADGYIARKDMTRVPRETHYWMLDPGRRLVVALSLLEAWHEADDDEPA
jgi:DNA-binding HxlR family transcriptional regulator